VLRTIDGRDIIAVLGLVLVTYGSGQIYPPMFYIVPGAALLGAWLWKARR
jgi:hypothetical protein